jgi:hypothetical protein
MQGLIRDAVTVPDAAIAAAEAPVLADVLLDEESDELDEAPVSSVGIHSTGRVAAAGGRTATSEELSA